MRRRDFLLGSSAAAFGAAFLPACFAADSDFRVPLVAMDGAGKIITLPQQQFDRTIRAVVYSLTQEVSQAENVAAEVGRLARGEIELKIKGLAGKLDERVADVKSVIDRIDEDVTSGRKLEGSISHTANEAIWLAAVSAREAAAVVDDLIGITLDPATTERIARTAMLMVAESAERNLQIAKVAASDEFRKAIPIDVTADIHGLVTRLPIARRALVETVLRLDPQVLRDNPSLAHEIFTKGIESVLADARKQYGEIASAVRLGRPLATFLSTPAYRSAVGDVQAVGTLASFVFGTVLGDRKTAEKISAGMQFASAAMKIGLAFATGGIGVLGVAGSLMSSLGALQGLFGGGEAESAVSTAMLQQISSQVESLRQEMHARFDRLEELQIKALNMLADIAQELKVTRVVLSEKIDELKVEVAQLDRYVRSVDRHNQLARFSELATEARIAIADGPQADRHSVIRTMAGFLHYAIDGSTHPAFTAAEHAGPLRDALMKADRIDLTAGLLNRACMQLGVRDTPTLTRNPLEWARGINGYMELQTSFQDATNPEIDNLVQSAWSAGVQVRRNLLKTVNEGNLKKAIDGFEKSVADQGLKIANAIRAGVFKDRQRAENWDDSRLTVGSFLQPPPVLKPVQSGTELQNLGESSSVYNEARTIRGPFLRVDNDPLAIGLKAGRLKLIEQGTERFSEIMTTPGGQTGTLWWTLKHFKLIDQEGRDLGPIGRLRAEVQNHIEVWDLLMREDRRPKALWETFGANSSIMGIDYGRDILSFLSKPENLNSAIDSANNEEMIAAIVLYSAVAGWSISDEPDDPWRSPAASLLPRNMDDIRSLLINLITGISRSELSLMAGGLDENFVLREMNRRHPTPGTGPAPDNNDPPWLAGQPQIVPPEPNDDDPRLTWEELRIPVRYDEMVRFTVDRWYQKGINSLRRLSRHLSSGNSIPLVDRTLLKLNGLRTYRV